MRRSNTLLPFLKGKTYFLCKKTRNILFFVFSNFELCIFRISGRSFFVEDLSYEYSEDHFEDWEKFEDEELRNRLESLRLTPHLNLKKQIEKISSLISDTITQKYEHCKVNIFLHSNNRR